VGAAQEVVRMLQPDHHARPVAELIETLLAVFCGTFSGGVSAKVALEQHGSLEISYYHPPDALPSLSRLQADEGSAGYTFQNQCVVYTPRTSFRHGIIQDISNPTAPYRMMPRVFRDLGHREYSSVLCVPISIHGCNYGVLNVDSNKPNAFHRLDFEHALFYGFVLALVLHQSSTIGKT
jgi:hypothetical protein